jgi:hypothetical protein
MTPPVEILVTVVIAIPTATLCEEDERVKAGAASVDALVVDDVEVGEVLTIFSAKVVIGAGEVAAFDEPFIL